MNLAEDKAKTAPSESNASLDDDLVVRAVQEYLAQVEAGQRPDPALFAARYPQLAPALADCLAGLDFVQAAVPELSEPAADRTASPLDSAAGTQAGTLGDFHIIREIGRGGMGIVYEAEQISLGRRVALKVLPFAATMDARQLQRFQNEVRAAASLQHPHIVPVYAVGCERGVHFYAMQFIDGCSLEAVVRELRNEAAERSEESAGVRSERAELISPSPLYSGDSGERGWGEGAEPPHASPHPRPLSPEYREEGSKVVAADTPRPGPQTLRATTQSNRERFRRVADWGIQAARALEHAHSMGMVHRDIKPANLLVDAHGQLWVTDFGLARTAANPGLTMTGDVVGTLRYMSPEQASAKHGLVDHRTDVYALGATLYELLTMEPAVGGKDREEILRNLALEEPKKPRSLNNLIPTDLETIVLKALSKEPADRYVTAQELAEDLERFVKDEPIRARRPALVRRLRGWCRRHRPLVIGVVMSLLTVLVLGGAVLWSRERQNAATAAAVTKDLDEADGWQKQEQWAKARQALERAKGRLDGGGSGSLQSQVEERWREVDLVARLEEAQLTAASIVLPDRKHDYAEADRAYAKAFGENGLDVTALPAEAIARRIQASRIRVRLVTALDYWAFVKDLLPNGNGEPLRAINRLADDDSWRLKLRDPRLARDPQTLTGLADGDEVLAQPPANLLIVCYLLDKVKGKATAAQLLRRAQARYPTDFWLNFELAMHWDLNPATLDEAIGFLRAALALRPQSPQVHHTLGIDLWYQKKLPEAATALRKAIELQADYADAYTNLGSVLHEQRKLPEAEAAYRKAVELKPDNRKTYSYLGNLLATQRKLPEAESAFRKAIQLQPDNSDGYVNLGQTLHSQQKLPEAIAAFRKAIELKPGDVSAYHSLGVVLLDQRKLPDAEAAFRKSIELAPPQRVVPNLFFKLDRQSDLAQSYNGLAATLVEQGKISDAVAACRKTIELKPDLAEPYYTLGSALYAQQKLSEAALAYRKAIELKPDFAQAYRNLGDVLGAQGKEAEAQAAVRKAIAVKPGYASAYFNLGNGLGRQQKLPEAVAAYRKAIELKSNYASAHFNLGLALREQGEFAEALASFKRSCELGHVRSAELVRTTEQFALLDPKLPKIMSGEAKPADSAERLALAELCQLPCRRLYAASVRFYREAFAAEPKFANDPGSGNRYNAACAAALAGCGQGKDGAQLEAEECARLRGQALAWLRADLTAWRLMLKKNPDKAHPVVPQKMRRWQRDTDFDGVRGEVALAKLPEAERQEWHALWKEVEELGRRAAEAK